MRLEVFLKDGPLTKLTKSQQERFISLLKKARSPDEEHGIVQSLLILGYAVIEK
ncbi:hypothetical protein [Cytobacillus firmus]|uniref:hypothetical protein n=1 Tax=Cytobacillus firmus TaxID=1399 RepID=UPI0004B97414|nr:hypothetical protein [Cytobacillus firmus]